MLITQLYFFVFRKFRVSFGYILAQIVFLEGLVKCIGKIRNFGYLI